MGENEEIQRLKSKIETLENQLQNTKRYTWFYLKSAYLSHSLVNSLITTNMQIETLRELLLLQNNITEEIQDLIDKTGKSLSSIGELLLSEKQDDDSIEGFEGVDIDELLKESVGMFLQKNNDVNLYLELSSQAFIVINPLWLTRCIEILIDNAVTAMQRSLEKRLIVRTTLSEDKVIIRISDTGPGIPDPIRQHLLKAQVSGGHGRGMGLLLARMIVEAYNGTIELEHTDSNGTTFKICLPKASPLTET